ncbi:hypothetical protein ACT4S2_17050 [Kocuria turfanensis]|uniref:hypothetical protein n=1 Tax=Kocuria turfanensis TaxID=388357 RepID=UPI0040354B27
MWWSPVAVVLLMLGTGLVFVVRRDALAKAYAHRVNSLPTEHPQYRTTPFATARLFVVVGVVSVVGGIGAILLGLVTP